MNNENILFWHLGSYDIDKFIKILDAFKSKGVIIPDNYYGALYMFQIKSDNMVLFGYPGQTIQLSYSWEFYYRIIKKEGKELIL